MTELEWYEEAALRLNYDPNTGGFSWVGNAKVKGRKTKDGIPGATASGKRVIGIHHNGKTKLFSCARIAWFIVHKEIPTSDVIHLNGNGLDDRISNLAPKVNGVVKTRNKRIFCIKSDIRPTDIEFYEYASSLVEYSHETGKFIDVRSGKDWKFLNVNGYNKISICLLGYKRTIAAHRLAWFIVHKELPIHTIDHINHIKTDNRISNLRDVPITINAKNKTKSSRNTSGVCGVSFIKSKNKWQAKIHANYKDVFKKFFATKEEAIAAITIERMNPEYSNHGFTETHGCPA